MSIPLVDLKAQYETIKADVDTAIQSILSSSNFILGQEVAMFEEEFAGFCGAKHCVGVNSGTDAIYLALRTLGIRAGDEVITVSHTFIGSTEPIGLLGARPVFIDIDPDHYTIDYAKVEEAITRHTRAILVVHLYGSPADMGSLMQIARKHSLMVVEDCAQAHGATLNGKHVGTIGDIGCFSFFPGKNLGAYGDAGAIVTNSSELEQKIRMLRNHGRLGKYQHDVEGINSRMDALQAAVLRVKLRHLPTWSDSRRRIAAKYTEQLNETTGIVLPCTPPGAQHAFHLYVVRVSHRDKLMDKLKSAGISSGVHYPIPLHLQPAYNHLGYSKGSFPITEMTCEEILSLPIYPELSDGQIAEIVDVLMQHLDS